MKKNNSINRRDFLFKGASTLAAAIAFPTIVPSSVFGANAPGNRITMGMVGMGLQMGGHLRGMLGRSEVQVLAVCDVDRNKLQSAKNSVERAYARATTAGTYKGCDAYNEYERICERPDIDAVFICTPDHWHAMISLAAVKSGKDVFCQKPMTLTIREGRMVSDACKRYGTIYQVGSQQRSNWAFRKACEIVRNGKIGKVHTIYARLGQFAPPMTLPEEPVPDGFDYDRWLGPTPWYPYNSERVKADFGGGWRRFWEYGSRKNGDWGAHHFDIIQWALGMDDSGPVKFVPKGCNGAEYQTHYYANGIKVLRDYPDTGGHMIRFIGTDGEVLVSRDNRIDTKPAELLQAPLLPDEIHLYESIDHDGNWLDCIRTRKKTICDAEIGHRTATICHLNAIAERLGRQIEWDPTEEKILNDPAAERWMDRPRRAPYVL
ncbi:MAG: Gfo/Idh/MocA family oxidoreductase [Sedimentisphaerales bacterium]|nr:Gfo/Idh/MocA family oxidoreductase [Sedimentisphaerales bacterium]